MKILLTVFLFIIFSSTALADVIKLKNGREIMGRLKEINEENVVLEIGIGATWFRKEQVESINGLTVEEAKAKVSTRDALIVGDKQEALDSSSREGITFISKTRKLEFKEVPKIEITDEIKIKKYLQEEMAEEKARVEARGKILVKLGFISNASDYVNKAAELFAEEVAGYYNPDDKKIYLKQTDLGEIHAGLPSVVLMHEQVHALQDQHYDLKKMMEKLLEENEDKALAIKSIIEGEATVLMYDASLRSLKGFGVGAEGPLKGFDLRSFVLDSMWAFSKNVKTEQGLPAIVMEDLLFPYIWGGKFIQHIVDTKGWEAVDTIYKDMPVSSEQIMHPEKYYLAKDEPKEASIPDVSSVLGGSWQKLETGTLGEFSFYLSGKLFLDELQGKVMSEGWGGDIFEFYEEPNTRQTILLSISKWDTPRDLDEFYSFYKELIAKKYKQRELIKEGQNYSSWRIGGESVYISKSADSVIVVEGAPENILDSLVKELTI